LHNAAIRGCSAAAQALLDANASGDVREKFMKTPLYYAVMGRYTDVIEVLLNAKVC